MSESFENPEDSWIRRKILVFFICIIISTLFWFLVVLSKDYNDHIVLPVNYVNIPKGKVIVNNLPNKVTVELRSFGFNLLKFRMFNPEDELLIDVEQQIRIKDATTGYIVTNSRLDRFASQMNGNIQLIRINPDTIFFHFDERKLTEVPVVADIDLDFADQFDLSGEIRIKPNKVRLIGGSKWLDTITSIKTEKLVLHDLEKPEVKKVKILIPPSYSSVFSEPSEVEISIPVDKYTEGSITVPVTVENPPAGYSVRTYPETVKIVYQVALSNYEKVKPDQFQVVADFSKLSQGSSRLRSELKKSSVFCRNPRVQPEKVEFILIRK